MDYTEPTLEAKAVKVEQASPALECTKRQTGVKLWWCEVVRIPPASELLQRYIRNNRINHIPEYELTMLTR